jgi:hypothetical protein
MQTKAESPMMLMVATLVVNVQISLAWLRAPTKPSCIQSAG